MARPDTKLSFAKMFCDALAMKITCSGGDGSRCRTCGPTRKLTRDVLTNLRGSITDALPIIRRCIGEYSGINWRYIVTVNNVLLESATVGDPSAMRRRVMVMS